MKFIHLSDLHLTENGTALFGVVPEARLDAAVDSILRDHADASFCVLSGDLADAGASNAYATLARAMARLPMPVYPMVGNHDDRRALVAAYPGVQTDENGFVQSAFDTARGRFLLLDTLNPGHAGGVYCPARQAWLRRLLDDEATRRCWIVMHHPPLAVGIPSMDQYALEDPESFFALLAPHRDKIGHLFFGHLHRPISGSWRGIPFSFVRSPNHQVALDMRTTSDVPGCHEPPGYAVVTIDDDAVIVHQHDFATQGERFWL